MIGADLSPSPAGSRLRLLQFSVAESSLPFVIVSCRVSYDDSQSVLGIIVCRWLLRNFMTSLVIDTF